jgi:hypothetical protein
MAADARKIPIQEYYRNIGIHDCQPRSRVKVVKAAIDYVLDELTRLEDLARYIEDRRHPPEARLLAYAKCEAAWELAAQDRRRRPTDIDMEVLKATVHCLDSLNWRSPWVYGSLLEPGPAPGAPKSVAREVPLEED